MMFYKETNFKEAPIGKIPKEWDVKEVSDIFETYKGTTPSTRIEEFWNGNIPFVVPTDITALENSNKMYLEKTEKYVTEKGLKSKNLRLVLEDSLLLTSRATIGYLAINKIKVAINQGIISLLPKKKVDVTFFFYLLQKLRYYLETLSGGSTFKEVSMSTFKDVKIVFPPLPEQQKIAEVLSTVDNAIQQTGEVIARTERLKKGLIQELLTKGIGHKEFKDTPIGKTPKTWQILSAEKICGKVTDGTHDTPKPTEEGYYLVTSKHIKNGGIDFSEAYFISEGDFIEVNKRSKVDYADVLFSMIGSVGMTAIVKREYPMFAIKNVGLFKTGGDFILAHWLSYYFQSPIAKRYLRNNLKGTTQKYIPLHSLRDFPIALPPFEERRKIAETISAVDKKLELERKEKVRLERIKRGFMDFLLSGKVRVKVA